MSVNGGPTPIYLLAGGRAALLRGPDPLLTRAVAGCGVASPSIAYVGAASGDNKAFLLMISGMLRQCGAGQINLAPLAGKRARVDKAQAVLEAADLVFVSGGDVEEGMRVVEEQQIAPFLRGLYQRGKPFFGVSAGSIMLARQWVRWQDPEDNSTAAPFPCLDFAPVTCDTHGEADGWEELQILLGLQPEGAVGYGIPSGGGLAVYPDGRLEALGVPTHVYAHVAGKVARQADMALSVAGVR
jgi:putative intracellular protease/amidase